MMILICLKSSALNEYYLSDSGNLSDPVEIAIRKFENHPSVQVVKQNISVNQDLSLLNKVPRVP